MSTKRTSTYGAYEVEVRFRETFTVGANNSEEAIQKVVYGNDVTRHEVIAWTRL